MSHQCGRVMFHVCDIVSAPFNHMDSSALPLQTLPWQRGHLHRMSLQDVMFRPSNPGGSPLDRHGRR
jgi:hypothetical protein